MNECERRGCNFWVKDHCADPVEYVNDIGAPCCRYWEGATPKNELPEAVIKEVATEFFYWWHNQPGANTQQGFDDWWKSNKAKYGFGER